MYCNTLLYKPQCAEPTSDWREGGRVGTDGRFKNQTARGGEIVETLKCSQVCGFMQSMVKCYCEWFLKKKHNVQSTVVPPDRNSTRFRGFHHKSSSALTITSFLLFHSEVLYIYISISIFFLFDSVVAFASLDIVLIQKKKREKKSFPVLFSCLINW